MSLYYYLMVIRQMYLFDPLEETKRVSISPVLWGLGVVLMVAIVAIGVYPTPLFEAADAAVEPLFQLGATNP